MNVVGKILAFVNLVFSLVLFSLVILLHIRQVNYSAELEKSYRTGAVDKSTIKTLVQEVIDTRTEGDTKLVLVTTNNKKLQEDNDALKLENTNLRTKLVEEEKKTNRADVAVKGTEAEIIARQADVEKMRETLKDEIKKNIDLVKDNGNLRDRAVGFEIQAKTVQDRNKLLEGQLRQMASDMQKIKANLGANNTTVRNGKNPPTERVDGLIKQADTASGLVKITIGSDAGLIRGHTLEVFRLNPTAPQQSKYLGTIRIMDLTATEAVGQPLGRMTMPPQAGDTVASHILGS